MKDSKLRKITVVVTVDTITINGVTLSGMKNKELDVDSDLVPLLLAHKFIKEPAGVTNHE